MAEKQLTCSQQGQGTIGYLSVIYTKTDTSFTVNTIAFVNTSSWFVDGMYNVSGTQIQLLKNNSIQSYATLSSFYVKDGRTPTSINKSFENLSGTYDIRICSPNDVSHLNLNTESGKYCYAASSMGSFTFSSSGEGGSDPEPDPSGEEPIQEDPPAYDGTFSTTNSIIYALNTGTDGNGQSWTNLRNFETLRLAVKELIDKRSYTPLSDSDKASFSLYSKKDNVKSSLVSNEKKNYFITQDETETNKKSFANAINIIYDLIKNNYLIVSSTYNTQKENIIGTEQNPKPAPGENTIIPPLKDYFTIVNYWNQDSSSSKCNGACVGFCSGSCAGQEYTNGTPSAGNGCLGSCSGQCYAVCSDQCGNICQGECEAACAEACTVNCMSGSTGGTCAGSCSGNCNTSSYINTNQPY